MENWIPMKPYHWMMWAGILLAAVAAACATAVWAGVADDITLPAGAIGAIAALAWAGAAWVTYVPRAGASFNIILGIGGGISLLIYGDGSLSGVFSLVFAILLVVAGWLTWVGISQDPAKGKAIQVGPASQGVVSAQHQAGVPGRRQS